jgi:hypothetical protein
MPGSVSVGFELDLLVTGDNVLSTTTIAANAQGYYDVTPVIFTDGENEVAVPSWAVGVQITPPNTNTVPIVMKGASADAGFNISPSTPTGPITFDPNNMPANLWFDVGEAFTAPTFFRFF